jgi:hypothetical protein
MAAIAPIEAFCVDISARPNSRVALRRRSPRVSVAQCTRRQLGVPSDASAAIS